MFCLNSGALEFLDGGLAFLINGLYGFVVRISNFVFFKIKFVPEVVYVSDDDFLPLVVFEDRADYFKNLVVQLVLYFEPELFQALNGVLLEKGNCGVLGSHSFEKCVYSVLLFFEQLYIVLLFIKRLQLHLELILLPSDLRLSLK